MRGRLYWLTIRTTMGRLHWNIVWVKNDSMDFLSLEARYYSKGESGTEYTNIIYVPKVKVLSDISLRVGENVAGPTLSTFNIVALAEKIDGESVVMRMLQLEEDVDGL